MKNRHREIILLFKCTPNRELWAYHRSQSSNPQLCDIGSATIDLKCLRTCFTIPVEAILPKFRVLALDTICQPRLFVTSFSISVGRFRIFHEKSLGSFGWFNRNFCDSFTESIFFELTALAPPFLDSPSLKFKFDHNGNSKSADGPQHPFNFDPGSCHKIFYCMMVSYNTDFQGFILAPFSSEQRWSQKSDFHTELLHILMFLARRIGECWKP